MPFPAKVLLFGEHTVLRGGRGLAIPYPKFSLQWAEGEVDDRLLAFAAYLKDNFSPDQLLTTRLERDLRGGACLVGDIPTGYGLGSSGAVCAAVWSRYGIAPREKYGTRDLRHILSRMERHFHGNSSGTDPLVSLLNQPLLLADGHIDTIELPKLESSALFLLDTGHTRQSGRLIEQFLAAYDDTSGDADKNSKSPAASEVVKEIALPKLDFRNENGQNKSMQIGDLIRSEWIPAVERAIDATIVGNAEALMKYFTAISEFQLAHFPDFIPSKFHDHWNGGDTYRLKLCGAGGGGMLLGLAKNETATEAKFGSNLRWL